jgi:hypothetical protein
MESTEMTVSTIHGDRLTSDDADCSNSDVRAEHARRTRAVVQLDKRGNLFYYADGDIDFLVIDERYPRDRVYALSSHEVPPAVIDQLIGDDRIGRLCDMPGIEEGIRAYINGEPAPKPKLTLVEPDDKG